ncbi:unnamed protein product [Menidia menidia]|uniref:(Atlantic silverside) hypothetical protein n=1 Tax=Menidia menidia TaxID=238744 RepID=A0A8S4BHC8_9TELE|nr:unnamed protein product [Menidia menidia]
MFVPILSELGANPLANSGIEPGAFEGLSTLYVGMAEAKLTAVPKDLPSSITELSLDYNKISKVEVEDFIRYKNLQRNIDLPSSITELSLDYNKISKVEVEDFIRYKNLQRLGLAFNQIRSVENGSFSSIPNIREIHLNHNRLKRVPPGLSALRYLQPSAAPWCVKKNLYTGISLFANPVKYWNIQPVAFRCVSGRRGIQLGNFRRK